MYWFITVVLAAVLYGYQYMIEKVIRQTKGTQPELEGREDSIF